MLVRGIANFVESYDLSVPGIATNATRVFEDIISILLYRKVMENAVISN